MEICMQGEHQDHFMISCCVWMIYVLHTYQIMAHILSATIHLSESQNIGVGKN